MQIVLNGKVTQQVCPNLEITKYIVDRAKRGGWRVVFWNDEILSMVKGEV